MGTVYSMGKIDPLQIETYLRGEFAGRIFDISKMIPVLTTLYDKGEIDQDLLSFLIQRRLVYYNSKTKVILSLSIDFVKEKLLVDVVKPQSQNWIEVQDLCAKLSELMSITQIEVTNELADKNNKLAKHGIA